MSGTGMIIPAIVSLFPRSGPAAITRLVVTVVVDAVQCGVCWSRSHVAQERTEIVVPLGAHLNATSTVRRIFTIRDQITSRLRGGPRSIFRRRATPVLVRELFRLFHPIAATTTNPARSQVITTYHTNRAARAATLRQWAWCLLENLQNRQPTIDQADHFCRWDAHAAIVVQVSMVSLEFV